MDQAEWEKILAYVDCHIHEKIDLCSLAEIAGYSPFYFSRIFAEEMGMPVTGYIRIRKLQYAAVSLLEGRKVLEVAMLYAFDSHEGFTRAFTRLFRLNAQYGEEIPGFLYCSGICCADGKKEVFND